MSNEQKQQRKKKGNVRAPRGPAGLPPSKPSKALTAKGTSSKPSRNSPVAEYAFERTTELTSDSISCPMNYARRGLATNHSGLFTVTARLAMEAALTTSGSGEITSVFTNSPTSAQNWSSWSGTFDEYRVLATRVMVRPLTIIGGSTASFKAPIAHVVDRTDATALTGYGLSTRYDSFAETPGDKPFQVTMIMSSAEEAAFIPIGTSSPTAWIKFYSSGNTVSTTVGRVTTLYLVQFRGTGI